MSNPTGINQYSKSDEYIPTPAEQKLLEVLCNPESLGKTITDICQEAGISREKYYQAIKKPGFFELRNKFIMDIVKASVGDIVMATIKYGKNNPKNQKDREVIMEMGGIYKKDINLNHKVATPIVDDI